MLFTILIWVVGTVIVGVLLDDWQAKRKRRQQPPPLPWECE